MRIILEPTDDPRDWPAGRHNKIVVESDSDDLTFDAVAEMVNNALIAWGFHPNTVLNEE